MISNLLKALVLIGAVAFDAVTEVAMDHRATLPEAEQKVTVYLSLLPAEGDEQADLATAAKLMVASASRQPIIEYCTPLQLGPAPVMAINLDRLQWDVKDFVKVLSRYPYDESEFPLVIRADWMLRELADGSESDAYRRLLCGTREGELLAKRDDVLKLFGVADKRVLTFGLVEGQSGVSRQGVRLIESRPILRGYCWITSDVLELTQEKDPLENLDRKFDFDGQEIIIGFPKISLATGDRGVAQAYMLANGAGEIVNEAPVDLVEDSTRFRGNAVIVAPGSCVQCHASGLNRTTLNDYREYLATGAQAYASEKQLLDIQTFYGASVDSEIAYANELYARFVTVVCAMTPEKASAAFKRSIERYDRDLDLAATAIELDTDPANWRNAIAVSGVAGGARLSGLAHGRTIPREAWEQQYLHARKLSKQTEAPK